MEESFTEFRNKVKKVTDKRKHKITGSLGIRAAFLFVQRNKWFNIGRVLKEQQFQQIIRGVNNLLAQELMKGNSITFPLRMGSLELRKYQGSVHNINGKLNINYPINWDATLKLWYEDKESYKNKQLVRYTQKEYIKIIYNKITANYENKAFFQFIANREIKRIITKRIKQGKIDAFEL